METVNKIDKYSVEIVKEVEPVAEVKTLDELEADLKMAQDSLAQIKAKQEEYNSAVQKTIDQMQNRLDQAKSLSIQAKPVAEDLEEIIP